MALNAMAARLDNHLCTEQDLTMLQERQRLARELHDGVKQQVFATGLQLHAVSQWLDRDPVRAAEALRRAQAINQSVSSDLVEMLSRLKPDQSAEPLGTALQRVLRPWVGQIETRIVAPEDLVVAPSTTHEISRIVAEAVANTLRRADAMQVDVRVSLNGTQLMVEVTDDGRGFDSARAREGMGLASMRQRVALLPQGRLELESSVRGTRLVVHALCRAEASA